MSMYYGLLLAISTPYGRSVLVLYSVLSAKHILIWLGAGALFIFMGSAVLLLRKSTEGEWKLKQVR